MRRDPLGLAVADFEIKPPLRGGFYLSRAGSGCVDPGLTQTASANTPVTLARGAQYALRFGLGYRRARLAHWERGIHPRISSMVLAAAAQARTGVALRGASLPVVAVMLKTTDAAQFAVDLAYREGRAVA